MDVNGLKIVISGGSETDKRYAQKIMPLREKGNLLLCTLLLVSNHLGSQCCIFQFHSLDLILLRLNLCFVRCFERGFSFCPECSRQQHILLNFASIRCGHRWRTLC